MPYIDDYTFLVDLLHLQAIPFSLTEIAKTIFTPHGPHLEHMIVFGRLAAILDYFIEGELNFRSLFFIGNTTLFFTALLLYYIARHAGLSIVHILPVAFLLFQPQYYENTTTWAICALQHVPALFFAFLTFYLLAQQSTLLFIVSFPTAFLGTFSNGNGLAVLATGFILLLINQSYRRLFIWSLFSLVSYCMYYTCTHVNQPPSEAINILHPLRVLGGFFLMNGSIGILYTRSLLILSLLGLLFTILFAIVAGFTVIRLPGFAFLAHRLPLVVQRRITIWFASTPKTISLPLIGFYIYLISSLLGISFARSMGWHYGLLVPRFLWFTTVFVIVGYLMVMALLKPVYRSTVGNFALFVSLFFCVSSYWLNYGEIVTIHKSLLSDLHNWRENELLITMPPDTRHLDKFYGETLDRAIKKGIYHLPDSEFETAIKNTAIKANKAVELMERDSVFNQSERTHDRLTFSPTALPFPTPFVDGSYLLLASDQHTYVWPIDQSLKKTAHFLVNGGPALTGNMATVFTDMLPAASYRVGVIYRIQDKWQVSYSSQAITVKQYIASEKLNTSDKQKTTKPPIALPNSQAGNHG